MAQEVARLQRAIVGTRARPGLADVLHELALDPHQILRTQEIWTSVERARRPISSRLGQALSRSGNLQKVDQELRHGNDSSDPQTSSRSWRPVKVLDARVEHSVDVFENRLLKLFVHQVERRLGRLNRFPSLVNRYPHLAVQAATLTETLRHAKRAARFLEEVTLPTHLPDRLTMVLIKRPPYRAAFEGYIELHRSVAVGMQNPALEAPLENLPQLYQVWGTLQVAQALLEAALEAGYRVKQHNLIRRNANGFYCELIPDGQPILILDHPLHQTTIRLIPERSYQKNGALHSVSFTQRPDIAIEIQSPDTATQVFLFDPKYKLDSEFLIDSRKTADSIVSPLSSTQIDDAIANGVVDIDDDDFEPAFGKPKKVDIDKMHTYRDAIRDQSGQNAVVYAAILYPGRDETYTTGLEAIRAYPGQETTLRHKIKLMLQLKPAN